MDLKTAVTNRRRIILWNSVKLGCTEKVVEIEEFFFDQGIVDWRGMLRIFWSLEYYHKTGQEQIRER